jgi:hypothetical protein
VAWVRGCCSVLRLLRARGALLTPAVRRVPHTRRWHGVCWARCWARVLASPS